MVSPRTRSDNIIEARLDGRTAAIDHFGAGSRLYRARRKFMREPRYPRKVAVYKCGRGNVIRARACGRRGPPLPQRRLHPPRPRERLGDGGCIDGYPVSSGTPTLRGICIRRDFNSPRPGTNSNDNASSRGYGGRSRAAKGRRARTGRRPAAATAGRMQIPDYKLKLSLEGGGGRERVDEGPKERSAAVASAGAISF